MIKKKMLQREALFTQIRKEENFPQALAQCLEDGMHMDEKVLSSHIHLIPQPSTALMRGTPVLSKARQDSYEKGNSIHILPLSLRLESLQSLVLYSGLGSDFEFLLTSCGSKTSLKLRITYGHQSSSKDALSFHER